MTKAEKPKPTPELAELLSLVKQGRLFKVQAWVQSGRVLPQWDHGPEYCPLCVAVRTGFHSIVEYILKSAHWGQKQLDTALSLAIFAKRVDLVDLLLARGAAVTAVDFADVCRTVSPETMEKFIRAGLDPARDNAFARALCDTKARPLLRFYRALKDEFPSLHAQASLALAEAANEGSVRWAALLRWAGADPFMKVPHDLQASWDMGEDDGHTAASCACWSRKGDLIRVLQLKPTPEQGRDLLASAAFSPSPAVMKELLRKIPASDLNSGDPPSSRAVERLVEGQTFYFGSEPVGDPNKTAADCLEILLDAGAKWRPEKGTISSIRRNLLKQATTYLVRILRLLIHTPGVSEPVLIDELCRSPVLRSKVAVNDKLLLKDIEALRRKVASHRP